MEDSNVQVFPGEFSNFNFYFILMHYISLKTNLPPYLTLNSTLNVMQTTDLQQIYFDQLKHFRKCGASQRHYLSWNLKDPKHPILLETNKERHLPHGIFGENQEAQNYHFVQSKDVNYDYWYICIHDVLDYKKFTHFPIFYILILHSKILLPPPHKTVMPKRLEIFPDDYLYFYGTWTEIF